MKENIGNILYKERKKRGLSQNTVAEKVGIKGASISNFEKNIYKPRDVTLQKLADLYEIDFLTLKKINDKTKRHNPRDIGKDLIGAVIDEWYERWLSKLIVDITKPNYLILAKEDLKIMLCDPYNERFNSISEEMRKF